MKIPFCLGCLLLLALQTACGVLPTLAPAATTTSTEFVYVEGGPREGQPAFPEMGSYWVIGKGWENSWVIDKGCNFSKDSVKRVNETFKQLRDEGIAEVAVICQTGILDKGATNDDKIWLRDWARWAKMGEKDVNRSVVWLIRPDAKPEEQAVTLEVSRWLTWYTAIEYSDALNKVSGFVNAKNYNGALISIAYNVDDRLRELWKTHQN
jgi:hypothetical protein